MDATHAVYRSVGQDLQKVRHVRRHFLDLRVVVSFDVLEGLHVVGRDEVDGHTLAAKPTRTTNPVQVVFHVVWEVVVDDERDLLDVDAARQQVGGDEHTAAAAAELAHNQLALLLIQITMHRRDGEVSFVHVVGEVVDLPARVAVDDGLCDGERLVEVREGLELPLLLLDGHVELPDTLEGQLLLLDQNADRVAHELARQVEDVGGHGGREQGHLDGRRQLAEHVVNLVLEAAAQHLVGLVQHEQVHAVQPEVLLVDHVVDAPGGANHHVHALRQLLDVVTHRRPAHTRVTLDLQVVTQSQHHLLNLLGEFSSGCEHECLALAYLVVDLLQDGDGECGRLAGTRLRLSDGVVSLEDGLDAPLLDGAGLLKSVRVDASQQVLVQPEAVEVLDDLVVVALDDGVVGQLLGPHLGGLVLTVAVAVEVTTVVISASVPAIAVVVTSAASVIVSVAVA
mmetsp:Transcript_53183/g.133887  ORF Transcript_53183/g.133887 Transcript_53183/m.133887 type:complete len:453 (-) Transcript_53183:180-1538(-)